MQKNNLAQMPLHKNCDKKDNYYNITKFNVLFKKKKGLNQHLIQDHSRKLRRLRISYEIYTFKRDIRWLCVIEMECSGGGILSILKIDS